MKKIKLAITATFLTLGLFQFSACNKIEEVKDTSLSAEDYSNSETSFASSFDISDDISSTDGKFKKTSSTILPSGAVLTITDSIMDSDGVKYNVNFGPKGSTSPFGMLCLDGKYRAGRIFIHQSKRYSEIGCVVTVSLLGGDSTFYTGDGTNMTAVTGTQTITRTSVNTVTVKTENGKAVNDKGNSEFSNFVTIVRTLDAAGPGILGDEFTVTGDGKGINTKGQPYTVTITSALIKRISLGCANTFIKGKLTIKNDGSKYDIKVDFDPFNNMACDRTAKAIIGSKEFIFTVK